MTLLTNSYETWLSYVNRYEMQCKFAHNHTYTNQHLKTNQFLYILSVWTNSLQVKRRKCGGATRVKRLWRMRRSEGYPENNKGSMRWTHFCNIPTFSPILSGRQWERESGNTVRNVKICPTRFHTKIIPCMKTYTAIEVFPSSIGRLL